MDICSCGIHTSKKCPVSADNIDDFLNLLLEMFTIGYAPEKYIYFAQEYGFDIANSEEVRKEIVHMLEYLLQTYKIQEDKKEILQILISYFSSIEQIRINQLNFLRKIRNGRSRRIQTK